MELCVPITHICAMEEKSWELFWDLLEDYAAVWTALAAATGLFGIASLVTLLVLPFNTSDPSVAISVVNVTLAGGLLLPLSYILYRIKKRSEKRNY